MDDRTMQIRTDGRAVVDGRVVSVGPGTREDPLGGLQLATSEGWISVTILSPLKRRTITLTGRAPVEIIEDDWPTLALATGDSYSGSDYGRHQQALGQGELDRYTLAVRQHADGRSIVYGVLSASPAWTGTEDYRGGVLLAAGAELAPAIRQVGEECGLPASVIRACIADLPAETI